MVKKMWKDLTIISKIGLTISFVAFAIAIVGCNLKFWKNYNEDNIIEEMVEDIIEHRTGIDIDLSPQTPETPEATPIRTSLKFIRSDEDHHPVPPIEPRIFLALCVL